MKQDRLEYLDGLRGVAALIVIFHHAMLALHPAYGDYTTHYIDRNQIVPLAPLALLWQGNIAVCIFFVLSGYVLARMTLRSQGTLAGLVSRRIVRLGVPIFAALFFGYLLWKLHLYANIPASDVSNSRGWWDYLYTGEPKLWSVLRDWVKMPVAPSKSKYDSVVWTMHWEYFGSFGIFLIYRLLAKRRLRIAVLIGLLCATFNNYYVDFVAGALLSEFDLQTLSARLGVTTRRIVTGSLLAGFVLFACNTWSAGPGTDYFALDWLPNLISGPHAEKAHQIGAIFLLAALLISPGLKAAFTGRVVQRLGHLSFAIYLLHLPLLCSLGAWIVLIGTPPLGLLTASVLAVAAVVVVTLALAVPFTRFIDVPATQVSQIVGRRVDIWWNRYCTAYVGKIWHRVPHGQAS